MTAARPMFRPMFRPPFRLLARRAALAALLLLGPGGLAHAADGWRCRNEQVEVSCDAGACAVSEAHTPMDVSVDPSRISVCAYTGCWEGPVALHVLKDGRAAFIGTDLAFSTVPDLRSDATVVIDIRSGVGAVLAAGFVNPVTCARN